MSSIYLDWAATAPPDPDIQQQVQESAQRFFANPSAVHGPGREAEQLLNDCRRRLAVLLGCAPEELVFTSGGTESNNMVLFSLLGKKRDRRILISGIEHPSVYQPVQRLKRLGFEVVQVPADTTGTIDAKRVLSALDEHTVLVAVMRSGKILLLHTDAVQAFGKIPFEPRLLSVDSASLSAHKLGGPRGVGALFLRGGRDQQFLYSGGGQEHGQRPGTENLPGIYGFVLAAEKAIEQMENNLRAAQEAMQTLIGELSGLDQVILIPDSRRLWKEADFSPYILNLSIPPLPGEVLVRVLEEEGFILSTGSACSSKKTERSRVLENMGISREHALSALRVSIGPGVGGQELQGLAAALKHRIPGLMKIASG